MRIQANYPRFEKKAFQDKPSTINVEMKTNHNSGPHELITGGITYVAWKSNLGYEESLWSKVLTLFYDLNLLFPNVMSMLKHSNYQLLLGGSRCRGDSIHLNIHCSHYQHDLLHLC